MKLYLSFRLLNKLILLFIVFHGATAIADERDEMQKQLNEQVFEKPFSVESEAALNAYIEEATKKGTPPNAQPSQYWRKGYTCGDLRRYSWNDYRDCSYYHRYYGRYWPY